MAPSQRNTSSGTTRGAFISVLMGLGIATPPGRSLDDLLERVRHATSETLEDDWTVLLIEHKGIVGALAS